MGFGYLAVGLLFLCNPNINVFDILPDCIGYCLIYHGLFRASFLSDRLGEARDGCWKLAIVTAVRLLSFLLVPQASETYKLVVTFSFGVVEAFFFLPFALNLFEGVYELGNRLDTTSVFDFRTVKRKGAEARVEYAERLKVYTIVFFFVKTVANIIPELTVLQADDTFASNQRLQVRLIDYRPLFYTLTVPIVLFFGIVWLVRMVKYLRLLRRDETLCRGVEDYYRLNVLTDEGLMAAIRMKKVLLLLILSAFGSMIFPIDGVDVIPNLLPALFVAIIMISLLRYDRSAAVGIALAAIVAALSVVGLALQFPYFDEYDAPASRFIANASVQYGRIRLLGTIEAVAVLLMFAWTFYVYCRVVKQHTFLIPFVGDSVQLRKITRQQMVANTVYARVLGAGIFGLLYLGFNTTYYFLAPSHESLWILNFVLSIPWIVSVFFLVSISREALYDRLERNY